MAADVVPTDTSCDVLVIGGGVMGLFTAYHAAERGARVVVLERGRIGDPLTASYGRTRSFRNDYLDAAYARLAHASFGLWQAFEAATGREVLVRCGCLNIAKRSITPELEQTYAARSFQTLRALDLPAESFDGAAVRRRFPQVDADLARLDLDAGIVDLVTVREALMDALRGRSVRTLEGVETVAIARDDATLRADTAAGAIAALSLVVAAGHGTNDVLARLRGCTLQVPITKDRPTDARYLVPPPAARERYTADAMPVIAYLDAGIYCHPIVPGLVNAVKIGYYNPPDMPRSATPIDSIPAFVDACLPELRDAPMRDVDDVDQCDYDLVADDEFVLGSIPGVPRAYVGVGWRGTGYKFAPWVGRVLADLALEGRTGDDLARFDPARFTVGRGARR
jgi:glycine/D-amino acid oxidase-like deaminating enzyme